MNFSKLPDRLARWATEVAEASATTGVDPFLIFAVMDRESLGGDALKPPGAGGVGDKGHGRGLMQIDDRAWPDWCRSERWFDAGTNILKGAQVLAHALATFRTYDGTPPAIAAYNAGEARIRRVLSRLTRPIQPAALDPYTTGGDYVSDVLRRLNHFRALCSDSQGAPI